MLVQKLIIYESDFVFFEKISIEQSSQPPNTVGIAQRQQVGVNPP